MARYNEILAGRYNRKLQKLFSMKGPASLVSMSDELISVWPFFNGAENRYLESWNRFALQMSNVAGGAGNVGTYRWRNPSASGVIAVIEGIWVEGGTGLLADRFGVFLRAESTDLGTVNSGLVDALDARQNQISSLVIIQQNNAAFANFGNLKFTAAIPAAGTYQFIVNQDQEMNILPGWGVTVEDFVANQTNAVSMMWRERAMEDSEKF